MLVPLFASGSNTGCKDLLSFLMPRFADEQLTVHQVGRNIVGVLFEQQIEIVNSCRSVAGAHTFHGESVAREGVCRGLLYKFFQHLPAGFLLVCHDGYRSIRREREVPKWGRAETNEAREE